MKHVTEEKMAVERLRLAAAGVDLQITAPRPWMSVGTAFVTGFVFAYFPALRKMLPGAMAGFVSKALAAQADDGCRTGRQAPPG